MATFLVGLTDEILPPLLYKPDYNLQYAEINVGTQKYNLYKDQLESLWADYFNSPLTNLTNIEERENIKKDVEENLAKFAGLNFADIKVYEGIKGLISKISSKKHIINDIAFTKRVGEFATTLDLLKLSPGTKENNYLTYNPDQSVELDRQIREFASLQDEEAIANYKFRDPIYKNYEKIVEDYIKDSGFEVKTVEVIEGGYYDEKGNFIPIQGKNLLGENVKDLMIVETKNGVFTIPEFHKMIEDYLVNNHGYSDYIAWKTDAELHKDLTNIYHTNNYMSLTNKDELLRTKWLLMLDKVDREFDEYDETTKTYEDIYNKMNQRKQYIDYQITGIEKKINDKQFSFNDIIELENLRQQKYDLERNLQRIADVNKDVNIKDQIDLLRKAKEIDEFKLETLKNVYKDMKLFNSINNMARTHVMLTTEQKIKESEFQLKRLGLRPAGGGADKIKTGEKIEVEYDVKNFGNAGAGTTVGSEYNPTYSYYPVSVIERLHDKPEEFKEIIKRSPLVKPVVIGENLFEKYGRELEIADFNPFTNAKNTYTATKDLKFLSPYFTNYRIDDKDSTLIIDIGSHNYSHKFILSNEIDRETNSSSKQLTIFRKPENVASTLSSDYIVNTGQTGITQNVFTQKLSIDIEKFKKEVVINIPEGLIKKNKGEKVTIDIEKHKGKESKGKELVVSFVPLPDPSDGSISYALNASILDNNKRRVLSEDKYNFSKIFEIKPDSTSGKTQ
jgi:hypothetical protein